MPQLELSDEMKSLIWGTPFGTVYPEKPNPPPPPVDGRTHALAILKKYISELVFYRTGDWNAAQKAYGEPVAFKIPARDIHVEWPDDEDELKLPSIVMTSNGAAEYAMIGLTSYVEEETRDVYGQGTVLMWMSEYTEKIALEIWAGKKAERRALLSGLEAALSPTEQMYGIRFRMPDYFNELVCFSLESREMTDSPDSARDRRTAKLVLEMRFNNVALINYVPITVTAEVNVDVEEATNTPVDLETEPPGLERDPRLPRDPLGTNDPC